MTDLSPYTTLDPPSPFDLEEWADLARVALNESDRLINQHFRRVGTVENKLDGVEANQALPGETFDPVTEADRGAEQIIRGFIENAFPDHGIVGEEFGVKTGSSDLSWIIDPIDGTRAFVAGLPTFGTLLGVRRDGSPVFGIMSQPFTGERFWGSRAGSFFDGPGGPRTLSSSSVSKLRDAVICSTDPNLFPFDDGQRARFEACREKAKIVRFGGDCYSYCLLAAGHVDLVVETRLQAYDIAPLIPIIEGAGGVVTNWLGGSAHEGGQVVASATEALHTEVLAILADQEIGLAGSSA